LDHNYYNKDADTLWLPPNKLFLLLLGKNRLKEEVEDMVVVDMVKDLEGLVKMDNPLEIGILILIKKTEEEEIQVVLVVVKEIKEKLKNKLPMIGIYN